MTFLFLETNIFLKIVFSLLDSKTLNADEQEKCREKKAAVYSVLLQSVCLAVELDVQRITRTSTLTSNFHDHFQVLLPSKIKY